VTLNSCVIFFHLRTWMGLLFIWHQDSLLSPCLQSLDMRDWLGLIQSPADDCREARGLLCCSCIRSFWMEIAGSSLWMPNMLAGCCQCCCLTIWCLGWAPTCHLLVSWSCQPALHTTGAFFTVISSIL
jgi:hypothetical protein